MRMQICSSQVCEGDREPKGPVFGSLETRQGTITIELDGEQKLYTLVAPDGRILASRVDAKQLEKRFPEG